MSAWKGAGKHAWDPSLTTDDLTKYLQYLWFSQYFNLTAMMALKLSISAFMLGFNFSKIYRRFVWATVVALVALNVVFPYIILFGECRPIAKHWDSELSGYCWGSTPRTISGGRTMTCCCSRVDIVYRLSRCRFEHHIGSFLHLCASRIH